MAVELDRFLEQWNLQLDDRPWQTASSVLAFVRDRGVSCVLKLPRTEDEKRSGRALLHFGARGCVRVLKCDEFSGATLMERVEPGEPLSAWVIGGFDEAAMAVICDTAQDLHSAGAPPSGSLPTIEHWGSGFDRYRNSGKRRVPADLVDCAARVFVELASSQGPRCLLHGDLHHDNILNDRHRGWLAIDPKGVVGEPAYELGAALRNPNDQPSHFAARAVIDRRIDMAVASLGTPRERIIGWAFTQAVLSAIWDCEDGLSPKNALAAADAFRPLL